MNLKGYFFNRGDCDPVIRRSPYSSEKLAWDFDYLPRESGERSRESLNLFLKEKGTPNISMGYLLDSVFISTFLKTN